MAAADRRALADVGRHARLQVGFERRGDGTRLASSYAEPPFRPPRGFPDGEHGLHAILTSSAPGIFGGDRFCQNVEVAPRARVRLTSQAAQQVHPSSDAGAASITALYRVAEGAHLHCAWDPSIPFAGARLDQRIAIELADDATLFWSDAVMAGREARGERWAFAELAHELRVARAGRLIYLERYRIQTAADFAHDNPWIAGSACYFGTVLVVGPCARVSGETITAQLAGSDGVRAAADRLDDDVLLVRVMSTSGPPFHDLRRRLTTIDRARC